MDSQRNVWIVDDDPIAVTIVRHLLSNHPELELTGEFENAERMLQRLDGDGAAPELVILDLNMPMMSGWELLDSLREKGHSNMPVAVFTSSIDERDELRSRQYPEVIGHFVKPMTHRLLNDIFEKLKSHNSN